MKTESGDKRKRIGSKQQKILLLLIGGLILGLSRSPSQQLRAIRELKKEWKEINRRTLNEGINNLYKSKLVETKDSRDGTLTLVLSKEGVRVALRYNIDNIAIKNPGHWDKKWRMVMFDVPERLKRVREALRMHFKNMGFYKFQKSVFVHPHPCDSEIEYIMEFYNARKYVRFVVATEIDNALVLKKHFQLS